MLDVIHSRCAIMAHSIDVLLHDKKLEASYDVRTMDG